MLGDLPRSRVFLSAFAAGSYAAVSISITLFNKTVLSSYKFTYPAIMSVSQMVCSMIVLVVTKRFKFIEYPDFDAQTFRKVAPLVGAFLAMVLSGLELLSVVNVPLFSAFRRLSTVLVIIGEYYILNKVASYQVIHSVFWMVAGALIAGWSHSILASSDGIWLLFLNAVSMAVYLILITKVKAETGLNNFGLMFYNNLGSIPVLIVYLLARGEFSTIREFDYLTDIDFQFCFVMQALLAMVLNYTIFFCTSVNSALTTNIVGQIKNVIVTALGMVLFGDFDMAFQSVSGIVIGTLASMYYVFVKYQEQQRAQVPVLPVTDRKDVPN